MPEATETNSFQPERVNTHPEWRLPNYAPPVDEDELRQRFKMHAATSNQVFDAFLARIAKSSSEAKH